MNRQAACNAWKWRWMILAFRINGYFHLEKSTKTERKGGGGEESEEMDEGRKKGDGDGCVAREEKQRDRWSARDGDRGTAFRFWDICTAMRGDRKSLWWMGGPTRGYKGGREVDNDRTRARDGGWRGLAERMWIRKFRKICFWDRQRRRGGGWGRRGKAQSGRCIHTDRLS